jgi:hypothetical protein
MTEEDSNNNTITSDDLSVLRVLLHQIKGISAVSSTTTYVPESDSTLDE